MNGKDIIMLIRTEPSRGHRALFDEYKNYVYAIVYNRLRNTGTKEDIEECVGEVFADVLIELERNETEIRELSGYISIVAKRKAIKYYHALSHINNQHEELNDELRTQENVSETAEINERNRMLLRLVEELGEPDSTIILMRFYYKRNSAEIAKKLGLKSSTVRKRIERALKKLRNKMIAAKIFDEEDKF